MEVVKVKNAHQQEGGGDENPGEQQRQAKSLQAQVVQAGGGREEKQEGVGTRISAELRACEENLIGFSGSKVAIGDGKMQMWMKMNGVVRLSDVPLKVGVLITLHPVGTVRVIDKRKIFVSNSHFWLISTPKIYYCSVIIFYQLHSQSLFLK